MTDRAVETRSKKAGEGARTLDIQLGRLTLYQLSYTRKATLRRPQKGL